MKTQFLGGAYQLRSLPLSAQTLVNLYAEKNESGEGEIGGFYGTPGLITRAQLAVGEVRALRAVNGYLFAVSGSQVYRVDSSWNATNIGTLPNSAGPLSMTDNGAQILFSHPNGWHYCTLTGSLTAVVDPDQPANAMVTEQDGYVLFTLTDNMFGLTALNDITSINPLDVASAEGAPDGLVTVFCDHREAWLFCNYTLEIWSDTGAAAFPFERIPGGMIEIGCAARFSVARIDDSLWWLSQDRGGNATIVRTNAYRPIRVSTHAIEHALEGYARVDDAIAWGYQQEGHAFYVITFPSADATWVYDCATQLWAQRSWRDSNGIQHRHRANCYAFFNGAHIVGDFSNGKLYQWDLDTFTDAGDVIYRERAWPISEQEHKRIRIDRLELVAETGVGSASGVDMNPQVWLQISRDGGQTFGYSWYQSLGRIGQRLARAVWKRLGLSRRPVAKLATTAINKIVWVGVNVDGEVMSQ